MRFLHRRPSSGARQVTLREAVSQGLAVFELWGVEEGVASKVKLKITKLTDEPLDILIPRGTEFVPVPRPPGPPASPRA